MTYDEFENKNLFKSPDISIDISMEYRNYIINIKEYWVYWYFSGTVIIIKDHNNLLEFHQLPIDLTLFGITGEDIKHINVNPHEVERRIKKLLSLRAFS